MFEEKGAGHKASGQVRGTRRVKSHLRCAGIFHYVLSIRLAERQPPYGRTTSHLRQTKKRSSKCKSTSYFTTQGNWIQYQMKFEKVLRVSEKFARHV